MLLKNDYQEMMESWGSDCTITPNLNDEVKKASKEYYNGKELVDGLVEKEILEKELTVLYDYNNKKDVNIVEGISFRSILVFIILILSPMMFKDYNFIISELTPLIVPFDSLTMGIPLVFITFAITAFYRSVLILIIAGLSSIVLFFLGSKITIIYLLTLCIFTILETIVVFIKRRTHKKTQSALYKKRDNLDIEKNKDFDLISENPKLLISALDSELSTNSKSRLLNTFNNRNEIKLEDLVVSYINNNENEIENV